MSEKTLYLLDGHALVYRAHYAFITRPLINSKGLNTSAINGFLRTLWDILKNKKPSHIAVSFDMHGPTFRHEMFEAYKANRDAQPEDITTAFPYIKKMVRAFNIPIVELQGYEADDLIGTLAKQAEREGFKVYMVTPDKDYAQLVSQNVFMYKPSRQGNGVDILGEDEVLEKWGIQRVDQVIDVLGLWGDSVDNIPGIPGIGEKTAKKLLAIYDSVEGIIENAEELKGKQKEKVIEFAEQGLLSKKLATINIDSPVTFNAEEFKLDAFNREALEVLFKELEFRTLADRILNYSEKTTEKNEEGVQKDLFGNIVDTKQKRTPRTSSKPAAHSVAEFTIHNVKHDYQLIDTKEKRADLIKMLSSEKSISFDTETTSIDANQAELVGLSFSVKAKEAFYIPLPEDYEDCKNVVQEFKPILESSKIKMIGQNIKYDVLVMKWYDIEVEGDFFDTMITHYLLEPDLRHNMDYISESYLKYTPVSITSLIGKKGKGQLTMREVPLDKITEYAAEDADITLQLKEVLEPKIKEEKLDDLYYKMEAPLIKVLAEMEYNGIRVDGDFLGTYSKELELEIAKKEKNIYEQAGVEFNIASPRQVGEVLFDKLKIKYRWRKTKTGQYSTDEDKLSELAPNNPIIQEILNFRAFAKLKSTYVDALPKMINAKTGRIHSSFNQALAATGRLSSNNPNLQNIPIKTEDGRRVREAFIPRDEDHFLLAADYSQIELRLIAEISKDEAMMEAFQAGHDIHTATAAKVYGKTLEEVSADERRNAKTVNFSIIYGAGATNLSRQLGIKRAESKELIETYFTQYHGLRKYMDETVEFARENGYVKTLMGRKRYLRDIDSRNSLARSNAERIAVNMPIQGSAADMIKIAMINIHEVFKKKNFKSKMILQVHDELVFDVHKSELDEIKALVEDKMKNAMPDLNVPILVGMGVGNNWLEAH